MVDIIMNDKTRDYILKKGGIITIDKKRPGNCWASLPLPEVRIGEPKSRDGYEKYMSDDICVYVVKSLEPKGEKVRIKLNSFLGLKSFDVTGFKVL